MTGTVRFVTNCALVAFSRKNHREVCATTQTWHPGWAVGHCAEFDPVLVHIEEKDFVVKMGVCDVVPRSAAAEKGCHVIRTRWVTVNKGSDDAPQLRAGWVAQEFRGVVAVTNTSTSRRHLTWR